MLRTAAIAIAGTSAVLAAVSRRETGSAAAGFNAASQLVWGERAAEPAGWSLRYTAVGAAGMASAVTGWSVLATLLAGRAPGARRAVAAGIAAGAIAYVVDYHVVPQRLAPGIELRLSRGGVVTVFAALAGALALGQLARSRASR